MSRVQASWARFRLPEPPPMERGDPPGSVLRTFPAPPDPRPPVSYAGGLAPLAAPPYRLLAGEPLPPASAFAPAGAALDYGSPVLARVAALLGRWRALVRPFAP